MNRSVEQILLHKVSRTLEVVFSDGDCFSFPGVFLRAFSPSADARRETVSFDPRLTILGVDPVGNYAIRLRFSDGHNTGLYSWDYLHELGREQKRYWEAYQARIESGIRGKD